MKGSITKMLTYGLSIAFNKGLALMMLPLVVNYLDPQTFGRLELMVTVAMFASVVVGFGLEDALYRYAGAERFQVTQRRQFTRIFTLSWAISVVFGMLYLLLRGSVNAEASLHEWLPLVNLVAAIVLFEGIVAIPMAWLRMQDKAAAFCFFSISKAGLQAVLILIFLRWQTSAEAVLLASVLATFFQAAGLVLWVKYNVGYLFDLRLKKNVYAFRKVLSYCSPLVVCGLIGFFLFSVDRWVLAAILSLEDLAVYAIALKLAMGIAILMQPFQMWWNPRRFAIAHQINGKKTIAHTVSQGWLFCLAMGLLVIALGPFLISYLLPATYLAAATYLPALVVVFLLKEWVELINLGTFWGDSTQVQTRINIQAVLFLLAIIFPGVYFGGVWGCVFVGVLVNMLRLVLYYRASQTQFFIPYPVKSWVGISTFSLSIALVGCVFDSLIFQMGMSLLALISLGIYLLKNNYVTLPGNKCDSAKIGII